MKIWKLSQDVNNDYDTYDSGIVVACTAEDAKLTHPSDSYVWSDGAWKDKWGSEDRGMWAPLDKIQVEEIGLAKDPTPRRICFSFNAG